jgi:hypothetical protein
MAPEIFLGGGTGRSSGEGAGDDDESSTSDSDPVRVSWYAADVYAFGILTWEVLQREEPFRGKSYERLHRAVGIRGKWPSPQLDPAVLQAAGFPDPPALIEVVKRCWDGDIEKRPLMRDVHVELGRQLAALAGPIPPLLPVAAGSGCGTGIRGGVYPGGAGTLAAGEGSDGDSLRTVDSSLRGLDCGPESFDGPSHVRSAAISAADSDTFPGGDGPSATRPGGRRETSTQSVSSVQLRGEQVPLASGPPQPQQSSMDCSGSLVNRAAKVREIIDRHAKQGVSLRVCAVIAAAAEVRPVARMLVHNAQREFEPRRGPCRPLGPGVFPAHIAISAHAGCIKVKLPSDREQGELVPAADPAYAEAEKREHLRGDLVQLVRLIAYLCLSGSPGWIEIQLMTTARLAELLVTAGFHEAADLVGIAIPAESHTKLLAHPFFWDMSRWTNWAGEAHNRLRNLRKKQQEKFAELDRVYRDNILGGTMSTDWSGLPPVLLAQIGGVGGLIPAHVLDDASRGVAHLVGAGKCWHHDHVDLAMSKGQTLKACTRDPCTLIDHWKKKCFCHAALTSPLAFHVEMRNAREHVGDWDGISCQSRLCAVITGDAAGSLDRAADDLFKRAFAFADPRPWEEAEDVHAALPGCVPPRHAGGHLPRFITERSPLLDLMRAEERLEAQPPNEH